jgi:hypothetical protein
MEIAMKSNPCLLIFMLTLSSCSIYKDQFDCPPPCGIPCTSVTDIESMIVETEQGPDVLVVPDKDEDNCWGKKKPQSRLRCQQKIWLCQTADGKRGYYLKEKIVADQKCLEPEEFFSYQTR